ncbi:peptidase [Clostridia bacterium]|nr:peptidase [Clostridia bacterium]
MTKIKNSLTGEEYISVKHKSGLEIALYPMKGYSSAYALFAARYGSVDTTFKTDGDADYVTVPEGIAHYLEHKLFENDECDAFELYAKTGASPNAFTSFDKTAYLFSCSQKFEENLRILLSFVQEPYFTDESVAKEQGIIGQEIKMYEDDPGWRVFFNCLQGLYHNNPVRIDIAGTKESIARIDKDLLYRCYNTFYNLGNMVLSVAGNFDVEKTLAICDELLKPAASAGLSAKIPDEPDTVPKNRTEQKLSCSQPLFQLGWKLRDAPKWSAAESAVQFVRYAILFEILFGETSDAYQKLYDEGVINDTFRAEVLNGRGFFVPMAGGEANDPDLVTARVKAVIEAAKESELDGFLDEFNLIKKKTYGELIKSMASVTATATAMMDAHLNGMTVFTMLDLTAEVTFEDVKAALRGIDSGNTCLSVISPVK